MIKILDISGAGPWIVIIIFLIIQNCCEKKSKNFEEFFKVDYFTGNGIDEVSGHYSEEKGSKIGFCHKKILGLGLWNNEIFRLAETHLSCKPQYRLLKNEIND